MSIRVALCHESSYSYDRPVIHSPHVIRLRPAPHCRTPIRSYSLKVEPEGHFINWQQDPFGNFLARIVFPEPIPNFRVTVDLVADLDVINPFDFFLDPSAEKYPFVYDEQLQKELKPYFEIVEDGPLLNEWISKVDRSETGTVDFLVHLNQQLQQDIRYLVRMEPGIQSCEESLTLRQGSCRDSGWLLVQIMRHLGLASRFVSGYLVQLRPDEKPIEGPHGPTQDFTDLHAWAEVYIPGAGWIGLDPTSGLIAGEGHIPLACTPDPTSAAPITGGLEKCEVNFGHKNEVARLTDPARPSKPYSATEWQAISDLAYEIDQDLSERDVRLTMGGEPTFVAIDNRDAPEWNTDALGPHKRQIAFELLFRLRDHLAPKGLLHFGQGKWYPGEPLPRWKFSCYWRLDGEPLWEDPSLVADERSPRGYGVVEAEQFITRLAERLCVGTECIVPGLEDTVYYLWKEGTLPVNVDPLKADVKDSMERQRLRRLLEQGLDKFSGFALPLSWSGGGWRSCRWEFRRGRMYLIPGDSPMGYRLPLDSLPWLPAEKQPITPMPAIFDPQAPLPNFRERVALRGQGIGQRAGLIEDSGHPSSERYFESNRQSDGSAGDGTNGDTSRTSYLTAPYVTPYDLTRTALCIEPRGGTLHVFMPPLRFLEQYLDLVATIEATAADLGMPVLIEGYEPPFDDRLRELSMAPDPGVLEVNAPPSDTWDGLVDLTELLYDQAKQSRLTTTKFLIDGRQVGTGGGNHVVIGGSTPSDSPLLRRPDVLRSLINFWQNHPSLSYLFSGLFIGPTSQSPRVDEARDENLYELETAFRLIPKDQLPPPWLVDRLFRHLLVDLTGNTHRSEFSIDKLYSPDSFSGRRGLLEMRGFEMPPSARMSLLQQLLIRALVSRFWHTPYEKPLVRWYTELHDRFMMPHYLWQDFRDVLWELRQGGYEFSLDWFLPHFEFRFPVYGTVQLDDIELELRMAIEPWNVLGEEATSGGTARFVDSSVERLQVLVRGMTDPRHILTCNTRRVPLRKTAIRGDFVSGVRFRSWQLPSSMHPTVPVHSPLIFDLFDTWTNRSLGGCTYHVHHPGGRNHEFMPVNEYEAEGRRLSRFWPMGHTSGTFNVMHEELQGDAPYMLDLLRPIQH